MRKSVRYTLRLLAIAGPVPGAAVREARVAAHDHRLHSPFRRRAIQADPRSQLLTLCYDRRTFKGGPHLTKLLKVLETPHLRG